MAKKPKVNIGDRFGKLVVCEKVDIPIETSFKNKDGSIRKESTGKTKVGWLCKCDCGGKITLPQNTLLTERSTLRSCNNCTPVKNPNYTSNKMSYEEQQEWDELYEYVKINILGYDEAQLLPSYIVVRLKGLLQGKFMANNKTLNNANYSYKTVLNTFKFCSPDIHRGLRSGSFRSEQHKVNYIFKIVENNINNVYLRMQNVEKAKEQTKNITIDTATHIGAEYQRKTKETTNKLLDDLW